MSTRHPLGIWVGYALEDAWEHYRYVGEYGADPRGLLVGKQETPGLAGPEASTDHEPIAEAPGGCSSECA